VIYKLIYIGVISTLISGCSYFGIGNKVELINKSGQEISNVKLWAADKLIWEGDLKSDETVFKNFTINHDGIFRISGLYGSRPLTSNDLGYVTPNDNQRHKIIITYNGYVIYDR